MLKKSLIVHRKSCYQSLSKIQSCLWFYYYVFINQEELEKLLIPQIKINGGRKPHIVRYQIYSKLSSLMETRGSIFEKCYPISLPLAHKMLIFAYKFPSSFGQWDPIKVMFLNSWSIFSRSNTFKTVFHIKNYYKTVATKTRNM